MKNQHEQLRVKRMFSVEEGERPEYQGSVFEKRRLDSRHCARNNGLDVITLYNRIRRLMILHRKEAVNLYCETTECI